LGLVVIDFDRYDGFSNKLLKLANMLNKLKLLIAIACVVAISSCGGGGGDTSGVVASNNNSTTTTTPVTTPNAGDCELPSYNYGDIKIPDTYAGSLQIPTPSGKLDASIIRTINLADFDSWGAKPATSNCTNKDQFRINAYIEDLNRVKKLGGERIWIYNYAHWEDFSKSIWIASEQEFILPRSVLKSVVEEAHKRNIKVYYAFQQSFDCDLKGVCLDFTKLSTDELSKLLESHKSQILSDAVFGASIGLDGIKIELDAFSPKRISDASQTTFDIYKNKINESIDNVRKIYKGKISYGSGGIYDPIIMNKVDEIIVPLYLSKVVNPFTVEQWKNEALSYLSNFKYWDINIFNIPTTTKTPISWEIYLSSGKDFYSPLGQQGERFCGKTQISQNNCLASSQLADFSMQAVAAEGTLQALSTQQLYKTGSISFYGFWHGDFLIPTDIGGAIVFPNLDNSIRNKPAEAIVKAWYSK
jgi:hypothetical protein